MKILIIARGYPTKKYNLNGIFEFDQAKALARAGHEVIYAAIDMRSLRRWRKWGYETLIKDGVQIEAINIPCGRIPKKILSKITESSLKKLYKRIFKKYGKPDIIHSHFINIGHAVTKLFKDSDIPLVHTEHLSGMNQEELSEYHQYLGNNTYNYMDKVITVSEVLAENLRNKFKIKPITISNIVDTSSFQYKPLNDSDNGFNFVSVGGLVTRKGMDLLIKAFYDAFNENNKIKLYIYGDGPQKKYLETLIEEFDLTNQVFLMGLVERKEIADQMQKSHCFVLASQLETFGVVYIEAMASGLPIIATKCGGPEDFVNYKNGILISVDSQGELVRAMQHMFKNISLYDRKRISNEARLKFSPEIIANRITEIYLEVSRENKH